MVEAAEAEAEAAAAKEVEEASSHVRNNESS